MIIKKSILYIARVIRKILYYDFDFKFNLKFKLISCIKVLLFIFLNIYSLNYLFASEINFIGPCSKDSLLTTHFSAGNEKSLGDITVEVLEQNMISYIGSSSGMISIFDTAYGEKAIIKTGPNSMLAFGWCFKVNEVAPEVYPDEIIVKENDKITWWFGAAKFENNEWVTQCTPSYEIRPKEFCE